MKELQLDELELSVRAYNCLRRAGVITVEDLCNRTKDDMLRVRNLGRKSLDEIIEKMAKHGLEFRREE